MYIHINVFVYIHIYVLHSNRLKLSSYFLTFHSHFLTFHSLFLNFHTQDGKDTPDALRCRSLSAKEPLIIGFFGGK